MRILFRVDGNKEMGLGHLVRSTALGQMLQNEFDIFFFCKEIPQENIKTISDLGFIFSHLENEDSFFDNIKQNDIVVLDGYHFDSNYQKEIKSCHATLVCIDDLHEKEFLADLIINHTPGITAQDYKTKPFTEYALGLDYVLLRPVFLEQAKRQRTIKIIQTILICFGGSDNKNLTQSCLQTVIQFPQFKKIIVVTGAAFQTSVSFSELIKSDNRIDLRNELRDQQMLDTMLESDLAVVPASGILFEVLSTGCIVISGTYVDNQRFVYENLKKANLFYDAGNFECYKLSDAISEVLGNVYNLVKSIDGKSSTRISKLFAQLNNELLCKMRYLSTSDMDLTFNWASNPDVRRYSFQKHQITKSEHTNWLLSKFDDINCHYLIMEYNQIPIGSIRFDIKGSEAMISYLLDPAYQGRGFGQIILKKGIEWIINLFLSNGESISVIRGDVLKMNIPSVKTFERLGFLKKEVKENLRFEKWI